MSLSGPTVRYDDTLNVPIEGEYKEKIRKFADTNGLSMAQAGRIAIKAFYDALEEESLGFEEILSRKFS